PARGGHAVGGGHRDGRRALVLVDRRHVPVPARRDRGRPDRHPRRPRRPLGDREGDGGRDGEGPGRAADAAGDRGHARAAHRGARAGGRGRAGAGRGRRRPALPPARPGPRRPARGGGRRLTPAGAAASPRAPRASTRGGGGVSEFGIDLGTANTVVYDAVQEVVYNEPSVLLRRRRGGRGGGIVAVGAEAAELLGRVPAGLQAMRPLQDGVVTDLEVARSYLRAVARRAVSSPWKRMHGRVAIGVPSGATALGRRALLAAADEAGMHRAAAIDEPIAGALACGIDPMDRRAHMVVDVGGGTAEAVAFCYGGVLTSRSCRVAGDEMTIAVFRHLRREHQLVVGERTAEEIKIRIGAETEPSLPVPGLDAGS